MRYALFSHVMFLVALAPLRGQSTASSAYSRKTADIVATTELLNTPIVFQKGTATLSGVARATLEVQAKALQANPGATVVIRPVVTDAADDQTAIALSRLRAAAVSQALISFGARAEQVATVSQGEEQHAQVWSAPTRVELQLQGGTTALAFGLKQTTTKVRTSPGAEVFTIPTNLANDSVTVLCHPPNLARFGVADTRGVAMGPLVPRRLTFISRSTSAIVSMDHDVSLVVDPDSVDMTAQSPDPRCK